MRRTREIVGLPVLNMRTGERAGWVEDVIFNDDKDLVAGIVLEGGHIFQATKGIPRAAVIAVGKDALTVEDVPFQEVIGTRWSQKVGNRVYTKGGEAQGTIEDVLLNDQAEIIVGYEVSDGLFADLMHGRGTIMHQHVITEGKDVLIVDDRASPWEQEYEGGSLK